MTAAPLQTLPNQEKRDKILDIARKRMMHYGVGKTTMSDIADEAQMAVGTIYLYFKNKDEIVQAIAQQCREEQDAFLQTILQNEAMTPAEKLETFFIEKFRYLQTFRSETPHGKELIAYLVQQFPDSIDTWEQRFEHAVATILKQGVQQSRFKMEDIPASAHLLRIATTGFFPLPYLEFPKYPLEKDLLILIRWFLQYWQVSS